MTSYQHKQILQQVAKVDTPPLERSDFDKWTRAARHIELLKQNSKSDELIIYASGEYSFVHSLVVPDCFLFPADEPDLLQWSCNPFRSAAGYVSSMGDQREVWIEREDRHRGARTLGNARDLIYGRTFEGWSASDSIYLEISQEYSHLTGIHWRPEYSSYIRYDDNGDLHESVSLTLRDEKLNVSCASFGWHDLEIYLSASRASLIRLFDFTLLDRENFSAWPDTAEQIVRTSCNITYKQKSGKDCAYTRGYQIISPRRPRRDVLRRIFGWERETTGFVEFIAQDWRNQAVRKISTDPDATTNYFEAAQNDLPYELSPAFFRPEVLSKYKTDKDKYKIGERDISCRSAWYLKGYDVNDAGQVHAYIYDLRRLPYSEQLHWLSFNEAPKANISERAFTTDFEGQFFNSQHPLREIVSVLQDWERIRTPWWTLRDARLIERVSLPITASIDEWADACMDLSKLIVEGFEVNWIRKRLKQYNIEFEAMEQSIKLLERLTQSALPGLREVQQIRSKVKGHAGSSEAQTIIKTAIKTHESLAGHFTAICGIIVAEIKMIEVSAQP